MVVPSPAHSLRTQMITGCEQSGPGQPPLQRHRMLARRKRNIAGVYADILQAEFGCPSGCGGFVAEQRKNLLMMFMDKAADITVNSIILHGTPKLLKQMIFLTEFRV